MVLDTRVRAKKGSVLFRAPCSAPEISEVLLSPFRGAIREVAPLHARPRVRSARIGSFCDLVAAPVWVQAWVGAVGRVRNASPIRDDPAFYNAGFVLGVVRSIAELLERPPRILPSRPLISWLLPN